MKKQQYFMSMNDIKKLLKNSAKEFNDVNKEYFYGMAEKGDIEVRAAEAYCGMYGNAIETYNKIVVKLLKNLEEFKRSENDNVRS